MSENSIAKFEKFLFDNKIATDEPIEFGKLVKYEDPERKSLGKKKAPRHYYIAFLNDNGNLWAKCGTHSTSFEIKNPVFTSYNEIEITPEEKEVMRVKIEQGHIKIEEEMEAHRQQGIVWSNKIWHESIEIDDTFNHEWLKKKRLSPNGIRYHEKHDQLIIPAYNSDGLIQSYQRIARDGTKKNGAGCVMRHCYHPIGNIEKSHTIYVGESWATCMPAHLASGQAAVATFGSGALPFIGKTLQNRYPDKTVYMLKDKGEAGDKAAVDWEMLVKTEIFEASEDDFSHLFATYGLDRVKEELDLNGLPLVTGLESINSKDQPIDWVVENFLDNQSINIFYAAGGTGKTLLAQQLALSISNGTPYMNKVTKERRVLYIDCEMGRVRYDRRLKKSYQLNNTPVKLPVSICIDDIIRQGRGRIDLYEPYWQKKLEKTFESFDVIIIDSFNKSSQLPEEGTREKHWRAIYEWLYIWRETKCIIFVHHTNKAGEMAGTQHIFNDADNAIELFKPVKKEDYPTKDLFQIAVNIIKGRDIPQQFCKQTTLTWTGEVSSCGGWTVQENTFHKRPTR